MIETALLSNLMSADLSIKTMNKFIKTIIILSLLFAVVFFGAAGFTAYKLYYAYSNKNSPPQFTENSRIPSAAISLLDAQSAVVKAAENVMPAVVSIEVEERQIIQGFKHPFSNDPFFKRFRFFGFDQFNIPDQEQIREGLGSGVIVDSSGIILTNHHVIDGADKIIVRLENGKEYPGKVIGSNEVIDVAVVKIESDKPFPYAELGNSDELKVGMFVLAFGTPFNKSLSQTVTMGIISALGRSGLGIEAVENFIQTDAAINKGNSGGPLVNLNGEVIGINVAIANSPGELGSAGVGFAIPINSAKHSLESIVKYGKVVRGYIGIGGQDISDELAKSLNLESTKGVAVTEVVEDGPASKADIKVRDVILKFNNVQIISWNSLLDAVARTPVGTQAEITIYRNGKTFNTSVIVAERPETIAKTKSPENNSGIGLISKLGIEVRYVEGVEAKQNGMPASGALLITKIISDSLAESLGLSEGSGILEIDRERVTSKEDVEKLLSTSKKHLMLIRQNGRNRFIVFTLE